MSIIQIVNVDYQPYVNVLGDNTLAQANRAGKGYALWNPTGATRLTSAVVDGTVMQADTRHAWITIKGGGVRIRTDGTDPTATSGHYIAPGTMIQVENQRQFLEQLRFINASGEISEVSATFFA